MATGGSFFSNSQELRLHARRLVQLGRQVIFVQLVVWVNSLCYGRQKLAFENACAPAHLLPIFLGSKGRCVRQLVPAHKACGQPARFDFFH